MIVGLANFAEDNFDQLPSCGFVPYILLLVRHWLKCGNCSLMSHLRQEFVNSNPLAVGLRLPPRPADFLIKCATDI